MIELIKLIIAKPGNAVTVILCLGVFTLGGIAGTTTTALAVIDKEQRISETYQAKADLNQEMFIRMDQNLIDLKLHFIPTK